MKKMVNETLNHEQAQEVAARVWDNVEADYQAAKESGLKLLARRDAGAAIRAFEWDGHISIDVKERDHKAGLDITMDQAHQLYEWLGKKLGK